MIKEEDIEKFTVEQLVGWEEYRQALYIQKSKSDDLFEKAITFIASGALGLTLTFHDKIVPTENVIYTFILILGWGFLVFTLLINLFSHYYSSKSIDSSINEIDGIIDYKITYTIFQNNLNKRNWRIDKLNVASIILLCTGLILILTYVSINIYYGKETQPETAVETYKSTNPQNGQSKSERAIDSATYIPIK